MATITVHIPDDLCEDMKRLAVANRRSISQQVIACIEQALGDRRLILKSCWRGARVAKKTRGRPITDAELTRAKRAGRP